MKLSPPENDRDGCVVIRMRQQDLPNLTSQQIAAMLEEMMLKKEAQDIRELWEVDEQLYSGTTATKD